MNKLVAFVIFIWVAPSLGLAQTDLIIHGTIVDFESKAPVPFASIAISNTTRGTAANENGKFMLIIKPDEKKNDLKISSIGYLTRNFSISELGEGNITLELKSDVKLLSEITVNEQAINPAAIIINAIDSIGKNYRADTFNLEFYSTLVANNSLTNQQFKLETLVLGYCRGYGTNAEKRFEILKKRTEGENFLKASEYPFWPTLEIHRADVISDPFKTGILNKDNIDKFEFTYDGVSLFEMDTVYKINYHAPKPTKKITGYGVVPNIYKGTIFITTTSNAVVRHDIETDQFQHSIIYRKIGEHYFPYLINGERRPNSIKFAKIKNSLILTNVRFNSIKKIDQKTNEFRNITELADDNEFWETNYPKKLE